MTREEQLARRRAQYAAAMADPYLRARRLAQRRELREKVNADPVRLAAERQRQRLWRVRRRKERPAEVAAMHHAAYMRQRERKGKVLFVASADENPHGAHLPLEPFALWLEAYGKAHKLTSAEAIGEDLGLVPRRTRVYLARDQEWVSLDVVDRALQAARWEVDVLVAGRLVRVFGLDDLYPDLRLDEAA